MHVCVRQELETAAVVVVIAVLILVRWGLVCVCVCVIVFATLECTYMHTLYIHIYLSIYLFCVFMYVLARVGSKSYVHNICTYVCMYEH